MPRRRCFSIACSELKRGASGAGLDYHVEVKKHYYSVPHGLLREAMWVRIGVRG
jgi:hypothetical protein